MVAPTHLRSFQAIELALRLGSLKAAADVLGITPAAAGQRVKALESYLGVDLLVRGRSGLMPSRALEQAAEHLATAFAQIEAAAELLELQRAHEIHVACPTDLADLWLTGRLRQFRAEYPSIRVIIDSAAAAQARGYDCVVDLREEGDNEIADRLYTDLVVAAASPDIARRIVDRPDAKDRIEFPLLNHEFYADDPLIGGWDRWAEPMGFRASSALRGLRFARLGGALDAAIGGAGVVLCGLSMLEPAIASGRIVLPFGAASGLSASRPVMAHYRPASLARPQVRRFRAWLARQGEETGAVIATRSGRSAIPPSA